MRDLAICPACGTYGSHLARCTHREPAVEIAQACWRLSEVRGPAGCSLKDVDAVCAYALAQLQREQAGGELAAAADRLRAATHGLLAASYTYRTVGMDHARANAREALNALELARVQGSRLP